MALNNACIDALGNEVIIGNWYGYSRNDSGYSHTTIGRAEKVTPKSGWIYDSPKVRLSELKVSHYSYGVPTEAPSWKKNPAKIITIASFMVFPVPNPTQE